MNSPLPYLIIPLLTCVWMLPTWRGKAGARVIIGVYALSTLLAGSGSLMPGELVRWAALGSSQGMFVSLSIGIAIGGMGPWLRHGWLWHVCALPLTLGLLFVFRDALQPLPLLLGAVLGALPLFIAGLVPRMVVTDAPHDEHGPRTLVVLMIAAVVAVMVGTYAISASGRVAPLAGSMESAVGASVLVAAMLMITPWPLHRMWLGATLVPAGVLLVYLMAGTIAPLGIAYWLPIAALLLVPSAIVAGWRGYWANALGSVAVLAVPRPGWQGQALIALLLVTMLVLTQGNLRSPNRISFPGRAFPAVLLSLAVALGSAALLAHEVVMGSLLAAGLATAAARPARPPSPL